MIRSFSSSGSTVVRQTGSTQTVRMQSITTSSVRRYQKTESTVISTGGWSQQFSATSIGHQWADQDRAFMLTEPRIMANEVLQKLESIKITEEDCALTRQKIDYILCEIKTMTEEEIKAAHTKFMEICPNGKMTRTMFANVLQEVFSEGNASDYCRYAFKLFDRDNNGTLSFTEFVFAMQIYSSNDLEDSLGLVFDIFDCDKSGTIDKKEIVQMIIATSALTDNSLEIQDAKNLTKQIMQSCDVRRVGKITKTEFVNGCKNLSEYCKVLVPGYDEDDYVATTSVLTELLGEQLLQHDTHGSTGTSKYIATSELGYKIIGLYFSGHWCPPSRDFTPKLVEAYKSIDHSMQDKFDIVLVSSDNDQNAFDHYFQEMPWKALPFSDRTRKQALVKKFNVKRIPCLIVLSSSGEVLTSKGVAEINAYGADSIRRWLQVSSQLQTITKCGEKFGGLTGGHSFDDFITNNLNSSYYLRGMISGLKKYPLDWCQFCYSSSNDNDKEIIIESELQGTYETDDVIERFIIEKNERINKIQVIVDHVMVYVNDAEKVIPLVRGIRLFTTHGRASESIDHLKGILYTEELSGYFVGYVTGRSGALIDQLQFHWYPNTIS